MPHAHDHQDHRHDRPHTHPQSPGALQREGHSHEHGHDHSHTPAVTHANERKVLLAFVITFTYMLVEVAGGLLSGSLALLADAGHMLTDAAALALSYAAFRFGRRHADPKRTFGYLRFEVIAGFINALTLFAIVIWIGYEAWQRFRQPHVLLAGPMLIVAAIGLLVNIVVFWILTRGDSEHVNIKGAALHVLGDLLGSIGAIVAALVIYATGWTPIDPLLSLLVSLLILRSAWALLKKSLHILLEGAPSNAAPQAIEQYLKAKVPGVADIHHVHVWMITSGRTLATLHVRAATGADVRTVVRQVEHELRTHFNVEHATVAIDWDDEEGASCLCSLSMPQNTLQHAEEQVSHHSDSHSQDTRGHAH